MKKLFIYLSILFIFSTSCQPENNSLGETSILKKTIERLVKSANQNLTQNADSSIWYAQQAYNLSRELKNKNTIHSLYILAQALYAKGEIYDALKNLIQAHELASDLNYVQIIPDILNLHGNIFGSLGQYDKSVDYYLKALNNYIDLNDKKNEAKVYNNLGLVFYRMNQIDKAYEYHKDALNIWDSLDYQAGLGSSYTNISYIFSTQDRYKEALKYLDNALKIYKKLGNFRREANTYINFGEVYIHMDQPDVALEYFERSLPMSSHGGFNDIYADGLNKKGWALFKLGRYEEAIEILKAGLTKAVEIKDPSLINEINLKLTNIYSSIGDYQSAVQYQQQWAAIKDSIFQDKSAEYIALFEVMYQTEAKEKRIELLEEANKRRILMFQF